MSAMSKYLLLILFLLLVIIQSAISSVPSQGDNLIPTIPSQYLYNLFSKGLSSNIFDNLQDIVTNGNVSTSCGKSLNLIDQGIKTFDLNAFKFIDSSAKIPSGLLDGTIASHGDYDECINIISEKLIGQHCTIKLKPSKNLINLIADGTISNSSKVDLLQSFSKSTLLMNTFPMSLGICFPDTCSKNDVSEIANQYLSSDYLIVGGSMSAKDPIICDTMESIKFDFYKFSFAQIISL